VTSVFGAPPTNPWRFEGPSSIGSAHSSEAACWSSHAARGITSARPVRSVFQNGIFLFFFFFSFLFFSFLFFSFRLLSEPRLFFL
jgi:hypothetical protein